MLPKTSISCGGREGTDEVATHYAASIASALRSELGSTHQATKTVMRWTGAGERTVTNWIAGEHGPSGPHLALLANHSDGVFEAFLALAGRERFIINISVRQLREELLNALAALDRIVSSERLGPP